MPLFDGGIVLPQDLSAAEVRNDISVLGINLFVNEFPFITRLPRLAVGTPTFDILTHKDRPRTYTLNAAIADGAATTITFTDASPVMPGDVFEMDTERFEVIDTDDTNSTLTANQIIIRRGAEGTTAAAHASTAANAVKLISNSRTGGEVDQPGIRAARTATQQYCQNWQFPVQVSGSAQTTTVQGIPDIFEDNRMSQLRNLYKDMEASTLYGLGEAPSPTNGRPKQKGLKTLIATNKTLTPTNAGAYTPVDLLRDVVEKPRAFGGRVDTLLMSTNFLGGLATWGQAQQRVDAGSNVFGTPIDTYQVPFLGGITIIEAFSLRPFTVVGLTSSKVRWRNKRNEFWKPRGSRGDAYEADWLAEGAIELIDEEQHAWVEGITAFAKP
jgi:hypothetical protein